MTRLRGWSRSETGGALVELAVALPVLVLVFVGTVDFARVFYMSISLNAAARAGVQFGAHGPVNSGDFLGMESIAKSATGLTDVAAVASRQCVCFFDDGSGFIPASSCNDVPQACPSLNGLHLVVTVTVTTSKTFTTIMSGVHGIPGYVSVSRTAKKRVVQ